LPFDEACPFEGQHHLVNGRWADPEVFLHVGFGWRPAVQAGVEVDERQILALLGREAEFGSARHLIHCRFIWASNQEAAMNVRYRVVLTQYKRNELGTLLSG